MEPSMSLTEKNRAPSNNSGRSASTGPAADSPGVVDDVLSQISAAIQQIRYGSVELTIHDGRVVQIERREKTRIAHDQSR
jgi:hypothetical protein